MNDQEQMVTLCISYFDLKLQFIKNRKIHQDSALKLYKLQTKVYPNNIDFV